MECLKQRIANPTLLRLISRFLKSGMKDVTKEDDGYEYIAEAYPKSCQAESMVEAAWAKVAWTLPLLRK